MQTTFNTLDLRRALLVAEDHPEGGEQLQHIVKMLEDRLNYGLFLDALLLISGVWAWAIMSIKTARPATIKEQTVKVSQFLRACKVQTVILWISAIGNFNIIRSQRACKEQTTIQWISAIGNLNRYVDIMGCCPCVR